MKSFTSRRFRELYGNLPEEVQSRAARAYRLFRDDPGHPGLRFKKIDDQNLVYSVRIGLGYRALGQVNGDAIVWFWIGSHAEYDKRL